MKSTQFFVIVNKDSFIDWYFFMIGIFYLQLKNREDDIK